MSAVSNGPRRYVRDKGTLEQRFFAKVDKESSESGCWLWTGFLQYGYGKYSYRSDGRTFTKSTHRLAYELLVGPIPKGLQLDHLCRVTACCNPDHLEPVTPRENIHRSTVIKDVCPQGHEYVEGSYYEYDWQRGRQCKECKRQQTLAYQKRVARSTATFVCDYCGETQKVTHRARHIRKRHPEQVDSIRAYRRAS